MLHSFVFFFFVIWKPIEGIQCTSTCASPPVVLLCPEIRYSCKNLSTFKYWNINR